MAGILMVAKARIRRNGALSSLHCLCKVLLFVFCDRCCTGRPLRKTGIVFPSYSLIILLPGRVAYTNLSQKSAPKILSATIELHTKKVITEVYNESWTIMLIVPRSLIRCIFASWIYGRCSCHVRLVHYARKTPFRTNVGLAPVSKIEKSFVDKPGGVSIFAKTL